MQLKSDWIICSAATVLVASLSMTAVLRADNPGELLVPTSQPAPTFAEAAPTTIPATQPAFTSANITPEARQMLQQMHDAYAGLKTLTVNGSIDAHLDIGGENRTEHADFTGLYQSPDKFRSEIKDKSLICSGGEKIYTYDPAKNVFTSIDTDKGRIDLKMLGADLSEALQEQDPSLALAISPDLADDMTSDAAAVTKVDDVKIDNATYPAIRIREDLIDITLAMDAQTHLLRRQIVDASRLASLRGAQDVKAAVFTVDYPTTAQAAIDPSQFAWTPPAGAQEQHDTSVAGHPAPAFTLAALDGKPFSAASLKGSVYVLDFWATWCPPCVASIPNLDKMYQEYKDRGVKVLALDQAEDKDTVQKFVTQNKLTLMVLLDTDGAVGAQYGADLGIPTTVVVGKNGIVRKVFLGSDHEDEIRAEVDAALKAR